MARGTVKVTQEAREQAEEGPKGAFKPRPAGVAFNVTISDAEERTISKEGANKGIKGVGLSFKFTSEMPGFTQFVFNTIWDVDKWPSSGKSNFQFFQFYKALGFDLSDENFELPDVEDLLGETLAVKLAIKADDYAYNKALTEWKGSEPSEDDKEKHAAWEEKKPSKGDFLKNEIKEFLPEVEDDDLGSNDDDEDGFDIV